LHEDDPFAVGRYLGEVIAHPVRWERRGP
jgi:hypothetical protein